MNVRMSVVQETWAAAKIIPKGYLPRVSRQSANYKSDDEMIPGTVHRSPGIYRMAEEAVDEWYAISRRF